jgi:PAS domain S-box-containing protein
MGERLMRIESKMEPVLGALLDSLPFDLFAIDENGRYFLQNVSCKQNWGNIIGKNPKDIATSKETQRLWEETNRRVFSGETIAEEQEVSVGGEKHFLYNILSPIHFNKKVRGIVGVIINMTK